MRTFTFSDGKSNKFWNITLQGQGFTVQFGKLGTTGQTQLKDFADDATAKKEHDKLVAEKLKKGYVESTVAAKPAPVAASPPAPAPAPKPVSKPPAPPPAPTPAPAVSAAGKRTFEFSDATSHKFWNIDLAGTNFTVTYGRIGTTGQTQLKSYPDTTKAQKEYDKLVAEKTSKGYRETTPTAKAGAQSLRESLEESLVENPDDLASHMAYADYLSDEGDPLGEFIRVQLALEDTSCSTAERNKLKKQEGKLLQQHQMTWLGELGPALLTPMKHQYEWRTLAATFTWVRGWLHTLEVSNYGVEATRVLARAPQLRLVRQLCLHDNNHEEPGEYTPGDDIPEDTDYPQLYPLVRCPYLSNVRTFILGETMTPEEENLGQDGGFSCHTQGDGVVGLIKRMPKLEELYLLAHNIDAEQLYSLKTLDHLRVLLHFHDKSYPLAKLAKNPSLGKLTHLSCHPHAIDDEEPYIRLAGLRAIVRSKDLKSLTHLRLRLTDVGDKGAQEVVDSGILKRLQVLDLRHGCMTDAGAQTLAVCRDLTNLERLDLSNNNISEEGVKALQATGVKVETGYQWRSTGVDYEEREYLYAGDIE